MNVCLINVNSKLHAKFCSGETHPTGLAINISNVILQSCPIFKLITIKQVHALTANRVYVILRSYFLLIVFLSCHGSVLNESSLRTCLLVDEQAAPSSEQVQYLTFI